MPKAESTVIGKIGSNDVLDINGFACIQLGKKAIGVTKVKMVLANLEACRMFIAQYDKPKIAPAPVAVAAPAVVTAPVTAPAAVAAPAQLAELDALRALVARLQAPATPAPTAPATTPKSSGRFVAA